MNSIKTRKQVSFTKGRESQARAPGESNRLIGSMKINSFL